MKIKIKFPICQKVYALQNIGADRDNNNIWKIATLSHENEPLLLEVYKIEANVYKNKSKVNYRLKQLNYDFTEMIVEEKDCFKTLKKAQLECDRRNKK